MKNILNWTLGGFFRSIGRYLAIFVIFIAITFILSISGLKLPSWLSFQVVHAVDTTVPISSSKYKIRTENRTTGAITTSSFINAGTNTTINEQTYRLTNLYGYIYLGSNTLTAGRTYTILVNWTLSPADSEWNDTIFKYFKGGINFNFYGNSSSTESGGSEEYIQNYSVRIEPSCSDCSRVRFYFTIVPAMDMKFFGFQIDLNNIYNDYDGIFNSFWNYINFPSGSSYQNIKYNSDDSANAINNQTIIIENEFDNVNNNINNINDTLNDTDTSSESSDASDWFHDFNLSIETPISDIVLLPINMLQYLIVDYNSNTTHPNLCTTFVGKQVCLPSGDILWKRSGCHDNSPFGCPNFSTFRTFFQLVVGGFIYYKLLRRLVSSAEKGLDPQESGVNMMKL